MVDVGKVSGDTYLQKPQNETNTQQESSLISIFNTNRDNTFSVEEQKAAYNFEIDNFCTKFKDLFEKYNFNLENFKTGIFQKLKDEDIEHATHKEVVELNTRGGILNAKKQILEFIEQKQLTDAGRGWGYEDIHVDYIFDKLEKNGINLDNIDIEKLTKILSGFDYDLDSDSDGTITTAEAIHGKEYMNKEADGSLKDTMVLDWIINKYLEKIQ